MTTPRLTAILALSADGALGDTTAPGGMPWSRLSRDLRRFRELTMGKACLVGRKTYDTLPRLPGRTLAVLTHSVRDFPRGDVALSGGSVQSALSWAKDAGYEEVYVIGGAEVYRALLPLCERVYLTTISASYPNADVRLDHAEVTDGRRCLSTEWHPRIATTPSGCGSASGCDREPAHPTRRAAAQPGGPGRRGAARRKVAADHR